MARAVQRESLPRAAAAVAGAALGGGELIVVELVRIARAAGGHRERGGDDQDDEEIARMRGATRGRAKKARHGAIRDSPSWSRTTRSMLRGEALVMRGDQRGAAFAADEAEEFGEDLVRGRLVEVARRFVGQHQRRAVGERARDRDALLLAARQFGGAMVEPLAEPERGRAG